MKNWLSIVTVALSVTILASCSSNLPRSDKYASLAAEFDRVFPVVWGDGTNELHTLMVLKDGKVIYERSAPGHSSDDLHVMWSATKTFTATAVGFAVQDGLLSTSDRIVDLIPELCPENPDPRLSDVTVWNLLTMSSGLGGSVSGDVARRGDMVDWARETLAQPLKSAPGELYDYNSMGSYLLSVIVTSVTGERVDKYLEKKLFKPLGIKDYYYEVSPQGYNSGGWGLFLSAESLAKMCQFMLDRGRWKGKQLLDNNWFDAAMSPQVLQYQNRTDDEDMIRRFKETDDWNQGYGYQMWCCRNNAFRLDGAWSQFGIIMPDKNMCVVALSHCGNGKLLLDSIWNYIYNNMR